MLPWLYFDRGDMGMHLEADLHIGNVVPVPGRREHRVGKAQHRQVLRQLLAEVMVNAVYLQAVQIVI